ncbi:MAG: PadR family transcriptional regulator [Promethearchaeota archaeon]
MVKKRFTPLKTFILGVFITYNKEMSGYELIKTAEEWRYDHFINATKASFYYTLKKLQKEGYIKEKEIKKEGNRPEQTIYTLNPKGRKEFEKQMEYFLNKVEELYFDLDVITPFILLFGFSKSKEYLINALNKQIKTRKKYNQHVNEGKRYVQSHELYGLNPFMILPIQHFELHNNAEIQWLIQFRELIKNIDFEANIKKIMKKKSKGVIIS